MTSTHPAVNRVRALRSLRGLTQAELATRAGISRTAVTAIEGEQLVPSVATALALASALEATVETLFGARSESPTASQWAWQPRGVAEPFWGAEVGARHWLYPAESLPTLTLPPDGVTRSDRALSPACSPLARRTLVVAGCDPAAGLLASAFAERTGWRMLVLPRSSRQSLELLGQGKVHAAGLHLSTPDDPQRNVAVVREMLGSSYRLLRIARWQEGIAASPTARVRSVRGALQARLRWIGREPGSGARQCLDRLLSNRAAPRRLASNHRAVAEAVSSGWADAGVCLQLASSEAGLSFIPVQQEGYDLCISESLLDDCRTRSLIQIVRSASYRQLLGNLPGYDTAETGELMAVEL